MESQPAPVNHKVNPPPVTPMDSQPVLVNNEVIPPPVAPIDSQPAPVNNEAIPPPVAVNNPPIDWELLGAIKDTLTSQMKVTCGKLRALKKPVVGSKQVLDKCIDRTRGGNMLTGGVLQLIFEKKIVPRAKVQAKLQKKSWMSFLHQLDGWMVERRARKEGHIIDLDLYYHHKSEYDFNSTISVVEFILHNRFQQTDKNSEPMGPENPPPLGEIGEESAKDLMLDGLNLEGEFIPPLVLLPLPLEARRPKRNDKIKSVPSNPSSSGKNGANGKEPVEAQPDSVPEAGRLDATDIEQPPLASTILTLEAPSEKRKYTRKFVPSEASSSKRPRKKKEVVFQEEEMEGLGLFMNFIGQNSMNVNNNESMFGRLVDDVLQWMARMDLQVHNQTTTTTPEPNPVVTHDVVGEPMVGATQD